MAKKKIISFIVAFVVSTIISGVIYLLLLIETFDLFGIEEITHPERRDAKLFYTGLAISILTIIIVTYFYRKNRKYAAVGIGIPNIIGFVLLIKVGVVYLNKSNYYEKFDKQVWLNSQTKPIKMARGLVNDKSLIGLTKQQAIELLGKGEEENWNGEERMQYPSDYYSRLGLAFEKGKVKATYIWVDD